MEHKEKFFWSLKRINVIFDILIKYFNEEEGARKNFIKLFEQYSDLTIFVLPSWDITNSTCVYKLYDNEVIVYKCGNNKKVNDEEFFKLRKNSIIANKELKNIIRKLKINNINGTE